MEHRFKILLSVSDESLGASAMNVLSCLPTDIIFSQFIIDPEMIFSISSMEKSFQEIRETVKNDTERLADNHKYVRVEHAITKVDGELYFYLLACTHRLIETDFNVGTSGLVKISNETLSELKTGQKKYQHVLSTDIAVLVQESVNNARTASSIKQKPWFFRL